MIIFHRPRHQSIVSIKFHAIYSNNWQIRGWGKNGVWIFMMIKHLQKVKINTCTCTFDVWYCLQKSASCSKHWLSIHNWQERRIKYIKKYMPSIYKSSANPQNKKVIVTIVKRKVLKHVSSSTISPDNWRAGDSRQLTGDRRLVVVVWGFGGRRPFLSFMPYVCCTFISWA